MFCVFYAVSYTHLKSYVFHSNRRKGKNNNNHRVKINKNKRIDPYLTRFIEKRNSIGACKTSICQLPYVQIDLEATNTLGLIDSGSTRSIISQQLATVLDSHNLIKRSQNVNIKCATANKQNLKISRSITAVSYTHLDVYKRQA